MSDFEYQTPSQPSYLISGFSHSNRGADVCCSAAVNYAVVLYEVSDRAYRVMERSFRLLDDLKPQ